MFYVLILLVFLCASCTDKSDIVQFPSVKNVYSNKLFETYVSVPLELNKEKDIIYISDFKGDSLLWCYNLNDTNFIKRLLPKGIGPDEFLSPVQFFFSDSTIYVYNRWHFYGKKYSFNKDSLIMKPLTKMIKYPTNIDMICPLTENRWIASGRFENSRFLILNNNGEIISKGGDYPEYKEGEREIPNFPKFMFHQSMFGFNKLISRILSVTSHVLDLWDFSQDSLILYKRVLLSPYDYNYNMGEEWASAEPIGETENGVRRVYVSPKYIYLLYDSNTLNMKKREKDKFNSEIWIFDWEGMPIQKLQIDAKLICFCVDEEENAIYGILNSPDPSICRIKY